jgi:uncharacterized protein (DUF305 family)
MKKHIFLGLILSVGVGIFTTSCMQNDANGNMSMNRNGMMNSNSSMNMMNSNSSMNMNGMNHNSMPMNSNTPMNHSNMKSDPNAASQPYDLQFLDTMTHHHQGAVEMAKMVLSKSSNEELKKFAQAIITDQNKEIAQMKDWREKWYAGKPAALNMEMSGMADSMKMMSGEGMKKMEGMMNKDFDIMFIDMMTPHHEGAIKMSKDALTKAEHAEIKTLAAAIIKAQEAEIKMMADWKTKWSK